MRIGPTRVAVGLAALLSIGVIAAGCGSDDSTTSTASSTTSTSATDSVDQAVDSAVQSCSEAAQNLGGSTGTAVEAACKSVGSAFQQDLSTAGDDVDQAISEAAQSCKQTVNQLPSGDAQDALSSLCDAIDSAGS
ncbi:MAG: hypothetical protein WBC01_05275 [Solirubrobacterales bacterium]